MKTKLTLTALLAALVLGAGEKQKHEVVLLWAQPQTYTTQDLRGAVSHYDGAVVYFSSSSAGAPHFPQQTMPATEPLSSLADDIALCLDQGFEIRHVSDNNLYVMLVK